MTSESLGVGLRCYSLLHLPGDGSVRPGLGVALRNSGPTSPAPTCPTQGLPVAACEIENTPGALARPRPVTSESPGLGIGSALPL